MPQIHCLYDKLINPKDLKDHPKNRNKHSSDQIERLAKLYSYHGIRHPIIVSKRSGFIVAGHGRKAGSIKAKIKEFPVVYQDFDTDEAEYAFIQADNAIALWAELDLSGINQDIGDLGPDFDIDLLGIKNFEIEVADKELGDEEAMPEHVEAKTKLGDIYQLGDHRLMCGDCRNMDSVAVLMDGSEANLVWTDPPYNVALGMETPEQAKARNRRTDGLIVKNDKMSDEDFRQFLRDALSSMAAFTKPGGGIYIAHADSEGYNFRGAAVEAGWLVKQCLIWKKSSLIMGRQDYHWMHEPILYGWKDGGSHEWYGDRKQTTILEFDKPSRNAEHPTMKPVELVEYCLTNSSKKQDVVMDMFGGSGTTMIASEKLSRSSRLMELDPHYCDVIVARWQNYTGKKAELING